MSYDDALAEAIRDVLDLDLPDPICDDAVGSRAVLMAALNAGMGSDQACAD